MVEVRARVGDGELVAEPPAGARSGPGSCRARRPCRCAARCRASARWSSAGRRVVHVDPQQVTGGGPEQRAGYGVAVRPGVDTRPPRSTVLTRRGQPGGDQALPARGAPPPPGARRRRPGRPRVPGTCRPTDRPAQRAPAAAPSRSGARLIDGTGSAPGVRLAVAGSEQRATGLSARRAGRCGRAWYSSASISPRANRSSRICWVAVLDRAGATGAAVARAAEEGDDRRRPPGPRTPPSSGS